MDTEGGGQILDGLTEPPAPHQVIDLAVGEASLGLASLPPRWDRGGLIGRQLDFGFGFV